MRRKHAVPTRAAAWMVIGILAMGALPAVADIYNGDFEADPPLDGWDDSGYKPPGSYVEGIIDPETISSVVHLHAETTYTYESGKWAGQLEQAYLQQFTTTLAGETRLRFDGRAVLDGLEVLEPGVSVIAAGGGGGHCSVSSDQWTEYVVELVDPFGDPLPAGTLIGVVVEVNANAPASAGAEGQQTSQVVDVHLDNFRLVPLPQAGLLLLAGAGVLLRRDRR